VEWFLGSCKKEKWGSPGGAAGEGSARQALALVATTLTSRHSAGDSEVKRISVTVQAASGTTVHPPSKKSSSDSFLSSGNPRSPESGEKTRARKRRTRESLQEDAGALNKEGEEVELSLG